MIQTKGSINAQIKILRGCIDQGHLYTDEELHQLKKELRNLTEQRSTFKSGHGFGNWSCKRYGYV